MTLTCSNIQRRIRALGLIPSNIQVNYQLALLRSLHSEVDQAYTLVVIDLNVRRKMSVGMSGVEHSGQKNLR
jgi:hypothetical protein